MDARPREFESEESEPSARDPFAPDPERLKIPEALREPATRPDRPGDNASKDAGDLAGMGKAWGTALDFVFTILAAALIGYFIGLWAGSSTAGLLIGLGMGFVTAFIRIVKQAQKEDRAAAARRRQRTPH